jgi:hypothetical protein
MVILNHSDYENIGMFKYFGPNNPKSAHRVKHMVPGNSLTWNGR